MGKNSKYIPYIHFFFLSYFILILFDAEFIYLDYRLSSEYNKMTEDKTQDWLKIAGLPESISEYTHDNHLTNSDIIDDQVFGSELLGN